MSWHVTADVEDFERVAGDFLRADPVRNTVLLTVVATLKTSGVATYGDAPPSYGWYDDGGVQAAFLRTPPMPALVSDAPVRAAEALVEVLDGVPGLSGPADSMRAFAGAWHAATGRSATAIDPARAVDRPLANGELVLWEVDGVPVSLAGATAPIAGVTRVAPVYTPAALRGRGYAGAVEWATLELGTRLAV